MNWITTNIRLPEDLYMDLKMKAALEKKSMASIIREKIAGSDSKGAIRGKKRVDMLLSKLKRLAERNAKENKGINMTKALIEMRYEQ